MIYTSLSTLCRSLIYLCFLQICLLGCESPPSSPVDPSSALETFPTLSPLFIDDFVFLGVWENPNQEETWFVGGNLTQRIIARYTARDHTIRIHLQEEGSPLWWVWGQGEDVWASGEQGTLLKLNRQTDLWEPEAIQLEEEQADKLIIWGMWGDSNGQWAVGGSVRRGGPKGVLLHRTHLPEASNESNEAQSDVYWERIRLDLLPMEDPNDPIVGLNLYKIWGDTEGVIWCVGEGGFSAFNLDPSNQDWQASPLITPPTLLFTLHGSNQDQLWTVGGYQNGLIWKWDPSRMQWNDYPLSFVPPLNGVFTSKDWLYLVGQQGYVGRLPLNPSWFDSPLPPPSFLQTQRILGTETMTFHATSSIKDELWVVGGTLDTFQTGVILTHMQPIPRLEIP